MTKTQSGESTPWSRVEQGLVRGGVILLSALGAAGLAGCAQQVSAEQSPTPSATSSEISTPTPNHSGSPEAHKFAGEVNYADFENWEGKDQIMKLEACRAFFEKNKPNSDVVWTDQSTGSEIASRFNAMFLVVASLNADTSNPLNQTVANNILDCMTVKHETSDAGNELVKGMLTINDGTVTTKYLPIVDPNAITRYSADVFVAHDYVGSPWIAKTIEGHDMGIGHDLITQEFAWNTADTDFNVYQLAITAPSDQITGNYFGDKPPVVVGQ